jgi:hypothetical protein
MKRLSSRGTFFYKRIFPVLWLAIAGPGLVGAIVAKTNQQDIPPPVFAVPVLMIVIGYVLYRQLLADLADEVTDAGNALIVRFGSEQERIALDNIINVSCTVMMNPPRATLLLRQPSRFGKRIAFSPIREGLGFSREMVQIEALIERLDAARIAAGRRT